VYQQEKGDVIVQETLGSPVFVESVRSVEDLPTEIPPPTRMSAFNNAAIFAA
jgi:hypothetical protein